MCTTVHDADDVNAPHWFVPTLKSCVTPKRLVWLLLSRFAVGFQFAHKIYSMLYKSEEMVIGE